MYDIAAIGPNATCSSAGGNHSKRRAGCQENTHRRSTWAIQFMAVRQLLRLSERALVRFAPLSFALFVASMSSAQVSGLVSSAASKQPIAGVAVHLCGRPPGSSDKVFARCVATTTDEKGQFEFPVSPAGILSTRKTS